MIRRTDRGRILLGVIAATAVAAVPSVSVGATSSLAAVTVPAARASGGAGAASAPSYTVPSGAIVVSTTGSNSNAGTSSAPLRTLGAAIAKASSGRTIVLRRGSYGEEVTVPSNKTLTIQNWPGEAVWLDGSVSLSGWVPDGGDWRVGGWTAQFDRSPTYVKGAPDSASGAWRWVNPNHPTAPWPEQVWIDGVAQRQVNARSKVVPGTFYVDLAANRLYVGSNPAGKSVRSSKLTRAMLLQGRNSVVRGIGIRRYATSVPMMGTVAITGTGSRLENVSVNDNATTGIFVGKPNVTLRDVTVASNGLAGVIASVADNLTVQRALLVNNNDERFNEAPVSGGIKVGRTRGFLIRDSRVYGNVGPGVWIDESVYNSRVVGNDLFSNTGHGMSVEISAKALIANNRIYGNGGSGKFAIKVNNTSDVRVWNNTILGSQRPLNVVQDTRRYRAGAAGADPRFPSGDPTMTWVNRPVQVRNNVIGLSSRCIVCVEDYSRKLTAAQMGVTMNSNLYQRAGASSTYWGLWSRGSVNVNPYVFSSFSAFRATTGQESLGAASDSAGYYTNSSGTLTRNVTAAASRATAIPADIAALIGVSSGTKRIGPLS